MDFSKIYQLLVNKATKKGRAKEEVDEVICWLTGYTQADLSQMMENTPTYKREIHGKNIAELERA